MNWFIIITLSCFVIGLLLHIQTLKIQCEVYKCAAFRLIHTMEKQ